MNLFKSKAARVAGTVACLGLLVALGGCNEMDDNSYSGAFSLDGQYDVLYSGSVKVELKPGSDVVTVYALCKGCQSKPDVKVSGAHHFSVYGCGSLKAENGAVVDVHDCATVKAMPGTKIDAINVGTVNAAQGVSVNTHGLSTVNYFKFNQDGTYTGTNDSGLSPVTPAAQQ